MVRWNAYGGGLARAMRQPGMCSCLPTLARTRNAHCGGAGRVELIPQPYGHCYKWLACCRQLLGGQIFDDWLDR